jgi:spore coat protein H
VVKLYIHPIIAFVALITSSTLTAQVHPADNNAFIQNEVASVFIEVDPTNLALMLHPDSLQANHEYPAKFKYVSSVLVDSVDNVGFRLRGNTSRFAAKKSFKVSMNTYVTGQKWLGLEKLNLNGEHNDPSILRSFLSASLLRDQNVISTRNSYVRLYVNGEYKGLYYNAEHIDENFLNLRFPGDDNGNLYKANWGADMTPHGTAQTAYVPYYELKTNTALNDYSGLISFLNTLNTCSDADFPCVIQQILDVDLYLRTLVIEVLAGHWDGHSYNKNNFYLYQRPSDGRFVFIEYDMDNTFGIDWMGINWATRNIYQWSQSNQPRPLYTRLMNVPYFKDLYTFYMDQAITSFYNEQDLNTLLTDKQTLIESAALEDTYKALDYGFTDQTFLDAIIQAAGGHVTSSLYSFILNRRSTANAQTNFQGLQNPCPLAIEELEPNQFVPIKAFNLMGQEVPLNSKGELLFLQDANGQTRTYFPIH